MADLRYLTEAIAAASQIPTLDRVEIHVDRISTITAALERTGITMETNSALAGSFPMFAGVPIKTNALMLPGFAIVVRNGEVIKVLDLRETVSSEVSDD